MPTHRVSVGAVSPRHRRSGERVGPGHTGESTRTAPPHGPAPAGTGLKAAHDAPTGDLVRRALDRRDAPGSCLRWVGSSRHDREILQGCQAQLPSLRSPAIGAAAGASRSPSPARLGRHPADPRVDPRPGLPVHRNRGRRPDPRRDPASAVPGQTLSIAGTRFPGNQRGAITWDETSVLATYRVARNGKFRVSVVIPTSSSSGGHRLAAQATSGVALNVPTSVQVVSTSSDAGPGSTQGRRWSGRQAVPTPRHRSTSRPRR